MANVRTLYADAYRAARNLETIEYVESCPQTAITMSIANNLRRQQRRFEFSLVDAPLDIVVAAYQSRAAYRRAE